MKLKRGKYLIKDSPEKMVVYLDANLLAKQEKEMMLSPELRHFIQSRLINVLDLKRMQLDPDRKNDNCIVCGVKQKILNYIERKYERDNEFTKTKYKNGPLRKQLNSIQKGGQHGFNNLDEAVCTHFETLESIISIEESLLDSYKAFMEYIPNQPIVGKKDVIHNICLNYYNLENLTEEEQQIYKDPKNFKALLTGPWIRIVKSMGAEEIGNDDYMEMRKPETDPFFAQIKNLKVRDVLKRIYNQYLEAPEEEKLKNNSKEPIFKKAEFFKKEEAFDVDEEVQKLKNFSKELRQVFKDQCIKTLCSKVNHFGSPRSPKAVQPSISPPGIDGALSSIVEKNHYYALTRDNQAYFHNEEGEGLDLYNYHQTTVKGDRKLRAFPGLPVPQKLVDQQGVFQMKKYRLEDANYIAIRDHTPIKIWI